MRRLKRLLWAGAIIYVAALLALLWEKGVLH
jgi:hypothetical protein